MSPKYEIKRGRWPKTDRVPKTKNSFTKSRTAKSWYCFLSGLDIVFGQTMIPAPGFSGSSCKSFKPVAGSGWKSLEPDKALSNNRPSAPTPVIRRKDSPSKTQAMSVGKLRTENVIIPQPPSRQPSSLSSTARRTSVSRFSYACLKCEMYRRMTLLFGLSQRISVGYHIYFVKSIHFLVHPSFFSSVAALQWTMYS